MKNKTNRKNSGTLIIWLKIICVLSFWVVYYFGIHFLSRIVHSEFYFVVPFTSRLLSMIGCFVFCLIVIVFSKKTARQMKNKNKITYIVLTICIAIILSPFAFINSATVADDYAIKKINMWGATTKEYRYEEITNCDFYTIPYRTGYQYEISFKDGSDFVLFSHEAAVNNFGNKENIIRFNKAISTK